MQTSRYRKNCRALLLAVWLGGIFPVPSLPAQPAPPVPGQRFLFIFDTSANMKKRVPAVQKAVNEIFLTSMQGQLSKGDTIGVWTFAAAVQPGRFPLQNWMPENAVMIASNINAFVQQQHYGKQTKFETILPLLNGVVEDSERLTVLIFCDDNGEFHGTPFDAGINQVFKQHRGDPQQKGQPMIIVLRSQFGDYIGCRITLPPQLLSLPPFPHMSQPSSGPAPVTNMPAAATVSPPSPPLPPLIIIWPKHPPAPTNPPAPVPQVPSPSANVPVTAPAITQPAGLPVSSNEMSAASVEPNLPAAPANAVTRQPTNPVAAPGDDPKVNSNGMMVMAGTLLALAGGLVIWMWRRSHAPAPASLISRSMSEDKKVPPPQA